jgi:hypothetical protein
MLLAVGTTLGLLGSYFAYRIIRPRLRREQKYDGGSVSDYWLQQQRGQADDNR